MKWSERVKLNSWGGLGIDNLKIKNRVSLAKWCGGLVKKKMFCGEKLLLPNIVRITGGVPRIVPRYKVLGLWNVISYFGEQSNGRGESFQNECEF